MARPDFAFQTAKHVFRTVRYDSTRVAGRYVAEPGSACLELSLTAQAVPAALLDEPLRRVVMAWVMARGGRKLNLNGEQREIAPSDLGIAPQGPIRSVVSIAPSNAEIVGALDAVDLLVGVESSSDYPPEVLQLPRLGPDLAVDFDALAALKPDLVLASLTVPGMERNIAALERLRLPYCVLAPRSLAEIRAGILQVGALLERHEAAQRVLSEMDEALADIDAHRAEATPVPLYLEWWPKPMFSPGATCWSNELIQRAGGVNVFSQLPGQSNEISIEQVVAADPQVIVLAWCGVPFDKLNVNRVLERAGLEQVRAVRQGHVFPVHEDLLGRPGPRVVEGIRRLAAAVRAATG